MIWRVFPVRDLGIWDFDVLSPRALETENPLQGSKDTTPPPKKKKGGPRCGTWGSVLRVWYRLAKTLENALTSMLRVHGSDCITSLL